MHMKADKLVELLFGTIILGTLAWLAFQVYGMNAYLSAMDSTLSDTLERVDRIANALPDVRARVAYEEVTKPFDMALVTTEPVEVSKDNWVIAIHLFDSTTSVRSTYNLRVQGPNDQDLIYKLTGKAVTSGLEPISFYELGKFSLEIKEPVTIPRYIDENASFVSRNNSPEYARWLATLGATKTTPVELQLDHWSDLVNELETNPGMYIVDWNN